MRYYTVHIPRDVAAAADAPQRAIFVKEGFCWPALIIPVIWLLFRRMWLVFVLWLLVAVAIGAAGRVVGEQAAGLASLAFAFLFALEANQLRTWKLKRAGYRLVGVASGRNQEEAELRYFAGLGETVPPPLPAAAAPPPAPPAPVQPVYPVETAQPVVGLFPQPAETR